MLNKAAWSYMFKNECEFWAHDSEGITPRILNIHSYCFVIQVS
jgi:hypothetical protein